MVGEPNPSTGTSAEATRMTHFGRRYGFGRGEDFYGVWELTARGNRLLVRWPLSSAGWFAAWTRYQQLEAEIASPVTASEAPALAGDEPGAVAPPLPVAAIAWLALGVAVSLVGLFPSYLVGHSLISQPDQLTAHVVLLAGWTGTALALAVARWRRAAAYFGVGLSLLAFAFELVDCCQVIASGAHLAGAGLILGIAGLLFAGEGSLLAFRAVTRDLPLGRLEWTSLPHHLGVIALGFGVAGFFAPAWDRFHLYSTLTGGETSVTVGNAFSNPGAVIVSYLVVMAAVAFVVVLGALLRPSLLGRALLAGAMVPMIGQLASAFVQAAYPPAATSFGIASPTGVQVSPGFTASFYLYLACTALVSLWCLAGLQRHAIAARPEIRPSAAFGVQS